MLFFFSTMVGKESVKCAKCGITSKENLSQGSSTEQDEDTRSSDKEKKPKKQVKFGDYLTQQEEQQKDMDKEKERRRSRSRSRSRDRRRSRSRSCDRSGDRKHRIGGSPRRSRRRRQAVKSAEPKENIKSPERKQEAKPEVEASQDAAPDVAEPAPTPPQADDDKHKCRSASPVNPNSLMSLAKLSPVKREHLAELRQKKRMPDAPQPKRVKRKGKGKAKDIETPAVPPAHVPQPWELQRSHDIAEEEGTSPDLIIPLPMLARGMQCTGTPPRTAPESVMDITDATEEICPFLITIPGPLTAESETVPPARTAPDCVMASITSTTAHGSGRRANELDVDVDYERDFVEPGEGSDVEYEEYIVDNTLRPRNVDEYPMDSDSLAVPSLAEAIRSIDAVDDVALRTVLDPGPDQDLLSFDWRCEPENFEGVREVFTVPCTGPTFENAELTPLGVFLKIWDADIIAHIVRETNRYGGEILTRTEKPHSRLKRWKDVTDDDIKKFFAIIMLQSLVINHVELEYWYPKLDELRIGNFGSIMTYNRFLEIKRCLHFVDNGSLPVHPNKLDKIMPIIEHLNKKFSSLYVLEQNITIDESLLLWKGRLSFSQLIATKKEKVGIKSYEMCESRTGYLWRMEVYTGKGHVHVAQGGEQEPVEEREKAGEPESVSSQIVLTLMRPLFNRGHTLVMDNFYNAPLLSRILKVKHKTDSMGTLRLTRDFVPETLRKMSKKNMKAGEVAFSSTKDLNVVVWMDKNVVAMISTFHQVKVGGIEKYGYYKYKPQVILDYNLSMGGIDHKDQMLHAYPIERVRNVVWYKKLFRRLVNVSIHNSFVMFNHNRTKVIGNREFRLQLAKELLQMCSPGALPRPIKPKVAPSQMHLPAKNKGPQRCKLCYAAKVRRSTVWRCSTCAVNLCIEGCYTEYHNRETETEN